MQTVELSQFASIIVYLVTIVLSVTSMNMAYKSNTKKAIRRWLILTILITSTPGFFRYMVGIDYGTYFYVGERIRNANSLEFAMTYWGRLESSFGLLVYWLGKHGITTHVAIGLYAVLTQIFMVLGIWKYRKDINPTIAFLIYMSLFYFRTYNMFRQSLSMAIVLFAIHFLREKKLWRFIACVLISTLIHRPALVSFLMIWYYRPIKKRTKWIDITICYILPVAIALAFELVMKFVTYIPFLSMYITTTDKYTTYRHESLLSLGTALLIIEIALYILHRRRYKRVENQELFEAVLDKAMLFEAVYFVLDFVAGFAARIVLFYSISSIISLSSLYNTKKTLKNNKLPKRKVTVYQGFIISYCIAQFVRIMMNNGYGQLPYSFWY